MVGALASCGPASLALRRDGISEKVGPIAPVACQPQCCRDGRVELCACKCRIAKPPSRGWPGCLERWRDENIASTGQAWPCRLEWRQLVVSVEIVAELDRVIGSPQPGSSL